jgi:hypothetical protein
VQDCGNIQPMAIMSSNAVTNCSDTAVLNDLNEIHIYTHIYIYILTVAVMVPKHCGDITDIGSRTILCDINVNTSLITIII